MVLNNSANNNLQGGMKQLSNFQKVNTLSLTDCQLTDEDLRELVSLPWENLQSIWISYNKISAKGVQYLTEHKWPQLTSLHLSN